MKADNRPVAQMVIVIAVIALLTFGAWRIAGKWAALVPIVLVPAWRFSRRLEVNEEMDAEGWAGRRFKDYWVYEEMQGQDRLSLSLKLRREDDDRLVLVVPADDDWRRHMPLWAAERRDEIIGRIVQSWPPGDVRWPAGDVARDPARRPA